MDIDWKVWLIFFASPRRVQRNLPSISMLTVKSLLMAVDRNLYRGWQLIMNQNVLQTHSITNNRDSNNDECPETKIKPKPNEWPKRPQYTKCFFKRFAWRPFVCELVCVCLAGMEDLYNKIFVCVCCADWNGAENKRFNFIWVLKWQRFPYAAIVHCVYLSFFFLGRSWETIVVGGNVAYAWCGWGVKNFYFCHWFTAYF